MPSSIPPGAEDQQTVAQAAGFHRVVGDQHDGAVYQQPGGQGLNARAGNRVERGKGSSISTMGRSS
jgi:hypothetical protein